MGHESLSEFKNKFKSDFVFISSSLDSGSNSIVVMASGFMLRVGELHTTATVSKVYKILLSFSSVI